MWRELYRWTRMITGNQLGESYSPKVRENEDLTKDIMVRVIRNSLILMAQLSNGGVDLDVEGEGKGNIKEVF